MQDVDRTKEPEAYSKLLERNIKKVATLDFTSERKTMSTIVRGYNQSGNTLLIKGAPERIIDKCRSYRKADGSIEPMNAYDKINLTAQIQKFAEEGLRILGISIIQDGGKLADVNENNV